MKSFIKILLLWSVLFSVSSCMKKEDKVACLLTVEIKVIRVSEGYIQLVAVPTNNVGKLFLTWNDKLGDDTLHLARDNSEEGRYILSFRDDLRCVANDTVDVYFCPEFMIDADGARYEVVGIGEQCWTKSNLRVSAGIPEINDSAFWTTTNAPAWCHPDGAPLSAPEFGKLYNWHAVASGKLCPAGWHIPTRLDWDTLINHLGGSLEAGGKMKSLSNFWWHPNTGASNSSNFSAFPAGYRSSNNTFWDVYKTNNIWSSTEFTDQVEAWYVTLNANSAGAFVGHSSKKSGYSCRCVQD